MISKERIFSILLGAHISEKATRLMETNNQIVFRINKTANKLEVKQAVETLFDVKVHNVRTLNVHGKSKRFGRSLGKRSDWKKAYVTLKEGHRIDLVGAEA